MKKIAILFCCLIMLMGAKAQENNSKFEASVRAGLIGSGLTIPKATFQNESEFGYNATQSMKPGALAGLVFDFQLVNQCYLQTGILYSWQRFGQVQNARYTDSLNTDYSIASQNLITMHRVKVPLMVNYRFSTESNHFVVGAGVYLDCAAGGNLTYDASAVLTPEGLAQQSYMMNGSFDPYKNDVKKIYYHEASDNYISSYKISDGNILNRVDFGASLELGYQISKFYVGVHADLGLLNSMNQNFTQHTYIQRNLNIQLMLGYKINE